MNLKSRTYMKSEEFKTRQLWLPFVDAVGIVLQTLEPLKATAWEWFKNWKKAFHGKTTKPIITAFQYPLPFNTNNVTITFNA